MKEMKDNKESLNIPIDSVEKVLEKHKDKKRIKPLYDRIEDLKKKRELN